MLERQERALNAHDVDALADCFHEDLHSDDLVHPSQTFRGREQVRQNWSLMIQNVPDLKAELRATAVEGDTVWGEWRIYGTRRDDRGRPPDRPRERQRRGRRGGGRAFTNASCAASSRLARGAGDEVRHDPSVRVQVSAPSALDELRLGRWTALHAGQLHRSRRRGSSGRGVSRRR